MKISISVIIFTDATVLLVSRSFRGRCLKQSSPNYKPPLSRAVPSH